MIQFNYKEVYMSIKERINTIKAKKAQIEALLSAKEKEVEEEYQMVMELYNEVSERVEVIKTKQKTTEEEMNLPGKRKRRWKKASFRSQ